MSITSKEWAGAVLFANYETIVEVVGEGKGAKGKARGGQKRVLHAQHHACWDAKNRWGLPDESPLSFEPIAPHVTDMRQMVPATKNVAKPPCQQNPLPSGAPTSAPSRPTDAPAPKVAGPGQTITYGAQGATVAPAAQPEAPAIAGKLPPQWDRVAQLCAADGYTCGEVMAASVMLGNFTQETPAENYPADYLDGCVAANWEKFKQHMDKVRADDVPF